MNGGDSLATASASPPVRLWSYVFPDLETRTDRLIRRLIITDIIFLMFATFASQNEIVVFSAVLAGNVVGAIIGLLFAVPKQATTIDSNAAAKGHRVVILANTSLEEVSDWLTKTIIGAGLVSWRQILGQLDQSGRILGEAVTTYGPNVSLAGGVAVLVASSALGAFISYLWFARHWPAELADTVRTSHGILGALGGEQQTTPVAPPEPNLPPPLPATNLPRPPGEAETKVVEDGGEGLVEGTTGAGTVAGDENVAVTEAGSMATTLDVAASLREAVLLKYAQMRSAPLVHHDWAKGMFCGQSTVSNKFGTRTLAGSVRRIERDWFEINLEIRADPKPATEAIFFLHNTFEQPTPTVGFDSSGVARLTIKGYGAFTVGALCDDGTTELELDLSQLESAPKTFRAR